MPSFASHSLFADLPSHLPDEMVDVLTRTETLRIERIVSHGHASPPGFWYDQADAEFVLLMSGSARLEFADGRPAVDLNPGDWLVIPPRERHRVAWTDPSQDTIWLAVHFSDLSFEGTP